MISYYDLLTMIKNGNAPKKVKYGGEIYECKNLAYVCEIEKHYEYLSECFYENTMFEKIIEIVEENKIEKINPDFEITNEEYLAYLGSKINEMIDYLNERNDKSGKGDDK